MTINLNHRFSRNVDSNKAVSSLWPPTQPTPFLYNFTCNVRSCFVHLLWLLGKQYLVSLPNITELRSNTDITAAMLLLCRKFAQILIKWCLFGGHSHTSDLSLFIYLFTYIYIYLFILLFIDLCVCFFSYAQLSNSNSIPDRSMALACILTRSSKLFMWKHQTYVQWISEAVKQPNREA